jgi:hypothetical protein
MRRYAVRCACTWRKDFNQSLSRSVGAEAIMRDTQRTLPGGPHLPPSQAPFKAGIGSSLPDCQVLLRKVP